MTALDDPRADAPGSLQARWRGARCTASTES